AALTHRFMLVDKWAALSGVTLQAGVVLTQERLTAAMDMLRHARASAFHRAPFVRLMTVSAGHLSFHFRMTMLELKLRANVEMTLETGLRRPFWIDDQVSRAPALRVETSRAVTRFTTDVHRVRSRRFQPRMRGRAEITHDFLVAIGAFVGADKFRARYSRRSDDCAIAIERSAGEEGDGEHIRAAD